MSAVGPDGTLFEGFAVCGLALPLTSIDVDGVGLQGRPIFRYKPAVLDQLLLDGKTLPLQLAACCMPDGVELVSASAAGARVKSADLAPRLYSLVLTDEGGKRLYVTCLSYLDAVPPAVQLASCHHFNSTSNNIDGDDEQKQQRLPLLGAQATRALCLVSRLPYLASAE
ncbi:hypothetical protein Agub_g13897, partial [Astrephomene gubernaculifera]